MSDDSLARAQKGIKRIGGFLSHLVSPGKKTRKSGGTSGRRKRRKPKVNTQSEYRERLLRIRKERV